MALTYAFYASTDFLCWKIGKQLENLQLNEKCHVSDCMACFPFSVFVSFCASILRMGCSVKGIGDFLGFLKILNQVWYIFFIDQDIFYVQLRVVWIFIISNINPALQDLI